ncbi:MAG: VWA domain-containing protein [Gammaproteobacteria bacterium]|nr:VWA domain-containing protein [Gammaproteobacteria bacterium]
MTNFHFIRPEWFLALLPLLLFSWLLLRKKLRGGQWQSVIDPQLLPHLLIGRPGQTSYWPITLFITTGMLTILSLAGPAWEQLPQPVYKQQSALVIALDLSHSMDAADISPSRLSRARYKIADILKQRKEGQTALIAYAANAFTVTPLTDDTDTINILVPSLTTDIMPAQGTNTSSALDKAAELMKNAGITKGDIFLITDGIEASALNTIKDLSNQGYRVSILAVGTADGAPIALADGGFLKAADGSIVIAKLDTKSLRNAALQSTGRYSLLSADDSDIKYLLGQLDSSGLSAKASDTERQADVWREEGPWLLLLVIPLAAIVFRRGYLVLLAALLLPYPDSASAFDWNELWLNDNQRAAQQLQQGNHQQAADLFKDPEWKAAAQYKAGDYQQAAEQLKAIDQADAHYNRGNALAKLGQSAEAIDAYNQALKQNPDHEDAAFNKQLLEQQQQEKNQSGEGDKSSQNNDQQSPSDQQQNSDQQNQNDTDKQQNTNNQTEQQNQQNEQSSQSDDQETQQQEQPSAQDSNSEKDNQAEQSQQSMAESEQQDLSDQAAKQWLRKIPDNPGDLLRRKFKYQYNNQQSQRNETQPW